MFSVIIPLYNKELSIKNTIQSVLDQSNQNFEIIIVNDGSTDDSAKIVESISDERIRLIQQKNQGVSVARNRGIKEASYDWIAFLDGDDIWSPDHLQEITSMMKSFPDEKVFVTSFEFSNKQPMFKHPRIEKIYKIENYFKEAIKEYIMWTSIVVVHQKCFDEVGGFNEKLSRGEDLELWARLAERFKIIKSDTITVIYRLDAENRSNINQKLEHCFEYHINLKDIIDKNKYQYFSLLINKKLYSYLRTRDIKNLIKLKSKQQKTNFILFLIKKLKKI